MILIGFGYSIPDKLRTSRFLVDFFSLGFMSSQQSPLTNDEKLRIIESYASGTPPRTIAAVLGKSLGSIKTFYCRWKLNSTLPPRVINNRTKIDGRMGLLIKKQVLDTPKLGLKKLTAKIKENVSDDV